MDDFAARKRFAITADFSLPTDFYTRQESYLRWITTDNFPGIMRSGAKVGALTADEWRVGFLVYGNDHRPRLISSHEGREELILWTGPQLSTGRHIVKLDFTPSQTTTGAFTLVIDGMQVASQGNIRTVPLTLADSEVVVTRVNGGIDGAANQATQRVSVELHSFNFTAER
jgi:hypothetical protein